MLSYTQFINESSYSLGTARSSDVTQYPSISGYELFWKNQAYRTLDWVRYSDAFHKEKEKIIFSIEKLSLLNIWFESKYNSLSASVSFFIHDTEYIGKIDMLNLPNRWIFKSDVFNEVWCTSDIIRRISDNIYLALRKELIKNEGKWQIKKDNWINLKNKLGQIKTLGESSIIELTNLEPTDSDALYVIYEANRYIIEPIDTWLLTLKCDKIS